MRISYQYSANASSKVLCRVLKESQSVGDAIKDDDLQLLSECIRIGVFHKVRRY